MGWFKRVREKFYFTLLNKMANYLIDHGAGDEIASRMSDGVIRHCFERVCDHYSSSKGVAIDEVTCSQASVLWKEDKCG